MGESLEITSGVSHYQVFQRDASGHAELAFRGRAELSAPCELQARLLRFGRSTPQFPWRGCGRVD